MTSIYIAMGLFLLFGIVLLLKGVHRLWRRRFIRGSLQGVTGMLFIALAMLALSLAINLHTYQVFNQEQVAAEVRIESLGPQYYRMYFIPTGQPAQLLEVRGDEWQIDARIIKWHGLATLIGLETVYQMERITGRYRDPQQARSAPRSVHVLANPPGFDIWHWSREYRQRIPWVDAVYGNAAYIPLANMARFKVNVSSSGLLIRAENEAAQKAVADWQSLP